MRNVGAGRVIRSVFSWEGGSGGLSGMAVLLDISHYKSGFTPDPGPLEL
jgi:hypothetical protein